MSAVFPINDDDRFADYALTAAQVLVAVPFPFQDNGDLKVTRISALGAKTVLAQPADYVLTGAGAPSGGTLTLTVAAAAGEHLTVEGRAVLARVTSIVRAGKFASAAIDADLDRALIIQQEIRRDADRAVKADFGVTPPVLPAPEAARVLGWDEDGNLINVANDAAAVAADLVAAQAAREGAELAETNAETAETLAETAKDDAETAAAAAAATAADVSGFTALAEAAADEASAARDAALLSEGLYQTTAQGIGLGLRAVTITAAGTGGTNGTWPWVTTGGTAVIGATGTVTIAGGAVVAVDVDQPGLYTVAPTAISITGAGALAGFTYALTAAANTAVGRYFSVPVSGSDTAAELYRVDAGPVAVLVTSYASVAALSGFAPLVTYSGAAMTAPRLIPAAGSVSPAIYRGWTVVVGHQYEMVAEVRADQLGRLQFYNSAASASGGVLAQMNAADGEIETNSGTVTLRRLGGGWYEAICKTAVITVGGSVNFQFRPSKGGIFPFTANGTDGIFCRSLKLCEAGTTTNLWPSSDPADASFTKGSLTVASGTTAEALNYSVLDVAANRAADFAALTTPQTIVTKVAENAGAGLYLQLYKNAGPVTIGEAFEATFRVKAGTRTRFKMHSSAGNLTYSRFFNLESGAVTGTGATGTATYAGDGYWDCKVSGTIAATGASFNVIGYILDTTDTMPRTGVAGEWLAIASAEVKTGGFTRFRDTEFSSWTLGGVTLTANSESIGGIGADLERMRSARNHAFYGKKVALLGTSITIQNYYAKILERRTGAILQNLGVSGACLASNAGAGSLVITTQIASVAADSDFVLVEAGTNDIDDSVTPTPSTLGALGDTTTATFYGALYNAYAAIKAQAPNAKIAFLTPYSAASTYTNGRKHFYTNTNGNTLAQFQQAVADVAELLGIKLIDVGRKGGVGYLTPELFSDGLHLNDAGGVVFGGYVTDETRNWAQT